MVGVKSDSSQLYKKKTDGTGYTKKKQMEGGYTKKKKINKMNNYIFCFYIFVGNL